MNNRGERAHGFVRVPAWRQSPANRSSSPLAKILYAPLHPCPGLFPCPNLAPASSSTPCCSSPPPRISSYAVARGCGRAAVRWWLRGWRLTSPCLPADCFWFPRGIPAAAAKGEMNFENKHNRTPQSRRIFSQSRTIPHARVHRHGSNVASRHPGIQITHQKPQFYSRTDDVNILKPGGQRAR